MVLARGKGERLYPLIEHRTKPAVPSRATFKIKNAGVANHLNKYIKRIPIRSTLGIPSALLYRIAQTA